MSQKNLLLAMSLIGFMLVSCNNGNGDDNFSNGTPSAVAIFTTPTGADLNANNATNYSFVVNVSGVNGPIGGGQFSAVMSNVTGTVDITGLAILFSNIVQTGTNSFSAVGTVIGPFLGQGTVNITVTYTEAGITIVNNSVTFTISITNFAVCEADITFMDHPDYADPTIVISGGPTTIFDVNVLVELSSNFNSDLQLVLTSPSATPVILTDGNGDGFNPVVFDDEALLPISIFDNNSFVTGSFSPAGDLSAFDGEDSNGTWTLSATASNFYGSYYPFAQIVLDQWCLLFDGNSTIPIEPLDPLFNCNGCNNCAILSITDGSSASSTFTITNGPTSIVDLNIRRLDITHPFPEQLAITLTSPTGTFVTLSSGNGAGDPNSYERITLDDLSLTSITTLSAPADFRSFFPEESLSAFNGEDANGDWVLTITDTITSTAALTGALNLWCLNFDGVTGGD